MVEPVSSRQAALQKWTARWNGPIFTALGLFWLGAIPFTPGTRNSLVIRLNLGVAFVLIGIAGTVIYLRDRRRAGLKKTSPPEPAVEPEK